MKFNAYYASQYAYFMGIVPMILSFITGQLMHYVIAGLIFFVIELTGVVLLLGQVSRKRHVVLDEDSVTIDHLRINHSQVVKIKYSLGKVYFVLRNKPIWNRVLSLKLAATENMDALKSGLSDWAKGHGVQFLEVKKGE